MKYRFLFLTIGILNLLCGSKHYVYTQNAPTIKWSEPTKSGMFIDGNTFLYLGKQENKYLFLIKDAYLNTYDESLNLISSYKIDTHRDRVLNAFCKGDSIYFIVYIPVKSNYYFKVKSVAGNSPEAYPEEGRDIGTIEGYEFMPKMAFSSDSSKILLYGDQKINHVKYIYYKVFDKNLNKLWENKTAKYNYYKKGKVLIANNGSVFRCDFKGKQYTEPVMVYVSSNGQNISEEPIDIGEDIISAPTLFEVNNQAILSFMYFNKGNFLSSDDKIGGISNFTYNPADGKQNNSAKIKFSEEETRLGISSIQYINNKYYYFCEHSSKFELFNNSGPSSANTTAAHANVDVIHHGRISILIVDNNKIEKNLYVSKSQKNNSGAADYFNSYNVIQANGNIYFLFNVRPKCIEKGCNEYFPVGMNMQAKPKIYKIDKDNNVEEVKLKYLNRPETELSVAISYNVVQGNKLIVFGESGFKTAVGIIEF